MDIESQQDIGFIKEQNDIASAWLEVDDENQ